MRYDVANISVILKYWALCWCLLLQGHRLGTADEAARLATAPASDAMDRQDDIPDPVYNSNLNDEQRAKIRADRAAAAEARLNKHGGGGKKPKKTASNDAPLVGPNSQPLMRWT